MDFSTTSSTQSSSGLTYTQASSGIASDPKAGASTAKDQVSVNLPDKGGDNHTVKPRAPIATKPNPEVAKDVVSSAQTADQYATRGQAVISEVATLLMNKSPIIDSHIKNFGGSILALLLSINAIANDADVETQKQLSDSQGKFNELYDAFAKQVTGALAAMCQRGQVLTDNANSDLKNQLETMIKTSNELMKEQFVSTLATSAISLGFSMGTNHFQGQSTQLEEMSKNMGHLHDESRKLNKPGPLKLSAEELSLSRGAAPAELKSKIATINDSLAEIDGFSRTAAKSTFSRDLASPEKMKQLEGTIKNLEDFTKEYSPHLENLQRYTNQEIRLNKFHPDANTAPSELAGSLHTYENRAYGLHPQTQEIATIEPHLTSFDKRLDLHLRHMDDPTVKIPHEMEFTNQEWHYIRHGHQQGVVVVNGNNGIAVDNSLPTRIRTNVAKFNEKLATGPLNISEHLSNATQSNHLATTVRNRLDHYTSFAKDLKIGYQQMYSAAEILDDKAKNPAKEYNLHEVKLEAAKYSRWATACNTIGQTSSQASHAMVNGYFSQQTNFTQSTFSTESQTITNNLNQASQINQTNSQPNAQIGTEQQQSIQQFTQAVAAKVDANRQASESRNSALWSMFAQLIGLLD